MIFEKSALLFEQAQKVIPGGVNSPVRAFRAVEMNPVFIARAEGSHVYDVDGNEFIDYVGSWGPLILGHAHPLVVEAIQKAATLGTSYGAPHAAEIEMAEMICDAFPSIDKVRLVNSGTEAAMSVIRLARAYTQRDKIIKFAGCYHGHGDSFLIEAGSGLLEGSVPSSPGVPKSLAGDTIICRYNNLNSVLEAFEKHGNEIAAIIVEPIAGNMGLIPGDPVFLQGLRDIANEYGSLLVFDEVITGFRVAYGGVQNILKVIPDLTCLGKIIGGGLPVGAYGGKQKIMDMVAPEGLVYQAGTLSGNPLAVAAGLATLKILKEGEWYEGLDVKSSILDHRLQAAINETGIDVELNFWGSMFCPFFTSRLVINLESALTSDTTKYKKFFAGMLKRGIYLPPSQFELCFISCAHTIEDLEKTAASAVEVLGELE